MVNSINPEVDFISCDLVAAKEILSIFKKYMNDACIAGGYARDLYYGVNPKDIDIVVCNFHPNESNESLLLSLCLEEVGRKYKFSSLLGDSAQDEDSSFNDSNVRVRQVYEVYHFDCGVEVILYEDLHPTSDSSYYRGMGARMNNIHAVISEFDYNINQFILDDEYNPKFIGRKHPDKYGLVKLRDDLTDERESRMELKWLAFRNKA